MYVCNAWVAIGGRLSDALTSGITCWDGGGGRGVWHVIGEACMYMWGNSEGVRIG